MSVGSTKRDDLYVYDLSQRILDSLELMIFDYGANEVDVKKTVISSPSAEGKKTHASNDIGVGSSVTCSKCSASIDGEEDRKDHYKSDWHRFNIKRHLNRLEPVGAAEFDQIMDQDDVESLSGSGDESDDSEDGDDLYKEDKDELTARFDEQLASMQICEQETGEGTSLSHLHTRSPQFFLKSSTLPDTEVFGIFKAIFSKETIERPLDTLRDWKSQASAQDRISAVFMIGGGHFAGAIVSHQRLNVKGNATKTDLSFQEQAVQFVEHKTFHRYTTRRKQGGSQSAMDNAKGKANSAGSSLRRYNEAALRNDVQNLLQSWRKFLEKCESIFIRAKSSNDRKMFINEQSGLTKDDERVKSFPFTTKRPTTNELKRAWCQLSYLSVEAKPQFASKQPENKEPKASKSSTPVPKQVEPENPGVIHTRELVTYLKKSKAPLLIAYLRKHKLDVNFKLEPTSEYIQTPTMLHFASQQGLKNMVSILLTNLKSDPAIKNQLDKTAWDLTRKMEVRQAFQVARGKLGEKYANWNEAHVGPPLSREDIEKEAQAREEQSERERIEAVQAELQAAKEKRLAEDQARKGPGKVLAGNLSSLQQNMNSLNDDQRMKIMREQRARAAEARMRQNQSR
ncbi:LAMI_0G00826g1_1 [Lachancea mirantina]|uniref:LAMI_0G00826g1_1 n=1 Tax=Lachancea mirantina TaxID=1230905 RepID=A0A1G4K791_9SACH|nr:LAMI_0G00826g1_1 [Lachancea mirantina]